MIRRVRTAIAAAFLLALPTASFAALSTYTQNFESLNAASPSALSGNGWIVYGNVFTPANVYMYGYGTFPAPNNSGGFCAIATGQGGVDQGTNQFSIYSDYNNLDHANGNLIESNTFREQTIVAGDVGSIWTFQFDAKHGNLTAPSTAWAFIKTLNPAAGYATTNFIRLDATNLSANWNTYRLSITIDPSLAGQILQIGFGNLATAYQSSGMFYDNLVWSRTDGVSVGGPALAALALAPAAPTPFRSSTRLDFTLPQRGFAEVAVYDVAGRLVTKLFEGDAEAGVHSAIWDGRTADGGLAPAGVYHGVLRTQAGRVTRNLVLAR